MSTHRASHLSRSFLNASTLRNRAFLGAIGFAASFCFAQPAIAQYRATAIGSGISASTTTPGPISYEYRRDDNTSVLYHSIAFTTDPVASIRYEGVVTQTPPRSGSDVFGSGTMSYDFYISSQPLTKIPITFAGIYSSSFAKTADATPNLFTNTYLQNLFGIGPKDGSTSGTRAEFQSSLYFATDPEAPVFRPMGIGSTTFTFDRTDPMSATGSFEGAIELMTDSNGYAIGTVNMSAGGRIWLSEGSSLRGTAFIDPHLAIDPVFLVANPGTTLTITEGVGNQITVVPEPGSYALMLAGLATLTLCTRRRAAQSPQPRA